MILDTAVCRECCISEHKQVVGRSVFAERYFRTGSTGQAIQLYLTNIVSDNGDLNIIY
jgi:hypothetical protein